MPQQKREDLASTRAIESEKVSIEDTKGPARVNDLETHAHGI
jgi:hypothetical protein